MNHTATVLVLALGASDWGPITKTLTNRYSYRFIVAKSASEARNALQSAQIELAVSEESADSSEGMNFLLNLRTSNPYILRIYVAPLATAVSADTAAKAAIYQFLHEPLYPDQLGLVLMRALEAQELARRHRLLAREFKVQQGPLSANDHASTLFRRPESQRFEKLVYASDRMAQVCNLAAQAAPTSLPIVIEGETGTGKELLARAIHYNSDRRASPLLVQNCGGISDEIGRAHV